MEEESQFSNNGPHGVSSDVNGSQTGQRVPGDRAPSVINLGTNEELELLAILTPIHVSNFTSGRENVPPAQRAEPITWNDGAGAGQGFVLLLNEDMKLDQECNNTIEQSGDNLEAESAQDNSTKNANIRSFEFESSSKADDTKEVPTLLLTRQNGAAEQSGLEINDENSQGPVEFIECLKIGNAVRPSKASIKKRVYVSLPKSKTQSTSNRPPLMQPGGLLKIKILRIFPPEEYLKADHGREPVCPSCGVRNKQLTRHMVGHVEKQDHSSGVIVDNAEYEYMRPGKIQLYGDKQDKGREQLYALKYHCPESNCRHGRNRRQHFDKMKLLAQHYRKVHTEKSFPCGKCSMSFATASLKVSHERTCGLEFKCSSCQSKYRLLTSLQTHARRLSHSYDHDGYRRLLNDARRGSTTSNTKTPSSANGLSSVTQAGSPSTSSKDHVDGADSSDVVIIMERLRRKNSAKAFKNGGKVKGANSHTKNMNAAQPLVIDLASDGEDAAGSRTVTDGHPTLTPNSEEIVIFEKIGKEVPCGRQNNSKRSIRRQSLGYSDLIPILPKPPATVQIPLKTDSQMQTDGTIMVGASELRLKKRRHSAATQTKPSKISIDTQTPRKRRRRSLKSLTSAETQTNAVGTARIEEIHALEDTIEEPAEDVGADQNLPQNSVAMDEFLEVSTRREQELTLVASPGEEKGAILEEPIQDSVGLSNILFTDMSTSPMHGIEELNLFPELLGAHIETQTDFDTEFNTYSINMARTQSSFTQTQDTIQEQNELTSQDLSLDFHIEEWIYLETTDISTQTQ